MKCVNTETKCKISSTSRLKAFCRQKKKIQFNLKKKLTTHKGLKKHGGKEKMLITLPQEKF